MSNKKRQKLIKEKEMFDLDKTKNKKIKHLKPKPDELELNECPECFELSYDFLTSKCRKCNYSPLW